MPRLLQVFLIALPALAQISGPVAITPAAPATGKGVIEGSVIDAVTHEPLKKVQVTLAGQLPSPPIAITDASGHFLFRELPAGSYWVNASRAGYNPPHSQIGMGSNVQVTLGGDEQRKGIQISLVPGGSISGRVQEEDGTPARGCSVTAVQQVYEQGKPNLRGVAGGTATNDKGEYRIPNLTQGRYYVFARCHSELAAPHPLLPRGDPRTPYETYLPQFYGAGGMDLSTATKLTVAAGASLDGIDIRVTRTPAYTIRGSIGAGDPEAASGNLSIMLFPSNPLLRGLMQIGAGANPQTRTFEIRSVTQGSYLLVAFNLQEGHAAYAQRTLEVGTTPPEPIEIALARGADLKGSIEYDSEEHPPFENTQVSLTPVEQTLYLPPPRGEIAKDGTFNMSGIVPGHWRLALGATGYIKSVTLGGQQISPYGFHIPPGATGPMHILMSAKTADVNVNVSGATADRNAYLLLYPEDPERMGAGLERISAGAGHIDLGGVAPGRYRLLATDTPNPWALLQRPDLLKALEGSTQGVDVPEGGRVSVTAEIISQEELMRALEEKE